MLPEFPLVPSLTFSSVKSRSQMCLPHGLGLSYGNLSPKVPFFPMPYLLSQRLVNISLSFMTARVMTWLDRIAHYFLVTVPCIFLAKPGGPSLLLSLH